jgi:hypothetical protein
MGTVDTRGSSPDLRNTQPYGRWALTLVVFPALVIFGTVYVVDGMFHLWLGNELGVAFLCYLIALVAVAAMREFITGRQRISTRIPANTRERQSAVVKAPASPPERGNDWKA